MTAFTGKVEYDQGLKTAVAQMVADELEVALSRVQVVLADTAQTPNEGMTTGSMSLETSGQALRWAAAAARHQLLSVAYELFEVPLKRLTVTDGRVVKSGGVVVAVEGSVAELVAGHYVQAAAPLTYPLRVTIGADATTRRASAAVANN